MSEKTEDVSVAKANLVEHLKNIDAACDERVFLQWKKSAV